MARKSRKTTVAEPAVIKPVDKVYRAGLYARISVETERKREADTIGNQELICKGWFLPSNTYDCGSFVVN